MKSKLDRDLFKDPGAAGRKIQTTERKTNTTTKKNTNELVGKLIFYHPS